MKVWTFFTPKTNFIERVGILYEKVIGIFVIFTRIQKKVSL